MRLAVLGSGMIVRDFLPHASDVDGLELVAICGRPGSVQRLEELQGRFGIERVYTDLDECLADADIDTVWIAVPNSLHASYARRALAAGKHVVCEKPFVLDEQELRDLRALAEDRDLILVEAISTIHLANYRWIQDHLDQVGEIRVIQCDYSQFSSRFDRFRAGEVIPAFDPAQGGGALLDIGIYTIHFVVGLLGMPEGVRYTPNVEGGVDTSGVLVLDYGDRTAVCVCAKDSDGPIRSKIQGTEGWIAVDGAPNAVPSVASQRRGEEIRMRDLSVHPHRMVEEFRVFVDMIARHDTDARDRLLDHSQTVLAVATAARRSAGLIPTEQDDR
ncbi:Gfo/Idh/MocA family protein [Microbacterium xanthum]|uniref:Gfo/Idh/MocA family protein n=1 Tax=Microbacterium xanthum TaxID=3079794 RepID=UPI002AD547DD|nr:MULTISPECIES: Gfo/Idh/MocA family oxidoreductase [unclassified Microbacterium]MDZ8171561.1 Gfo/Idh/MocA family oxidoreductase [Microbacterium sp. KSW-48]MDZ8200400.1 Gfo/Idh/MocA family oxidoreductase [Microbacterium sp. SSW1-59]